MPLYSCYQQGSYKSKPLMQKQIFFSIIIIGLIGSCQTTNDNSGNQNLTEISDSLTVELQNIYEQGFINGFSVAIVDKSGSLYQNGFGFADKNLGKEFTENSLINIGSITKTLVGLSLLKAQELELLSLDDPINDHLSFTVENPYFPDEQITIRQLTNHTSTIIDSDYFQETCYVMLVEPDTSQTFRITVPDFFNNPEDTTSLANYMESMLRVEADAYSKSGFLEAKPGDQYQYSNTGAGLAALIIESVSGMSFAEFAILNILKPLKMESSGWKRGNLDVDQFSKNYASIDTVYADYHLVNYPDGGLLTSAADLSNLLAELIRGFDGTGSLLSSQSFRALYAKDVIKELFADVEDDVIPEINTRLDKGIFMALGPKNAIGHTGADPGVVSFMFFNSETGIGKVLIVNMTIDNPSQPAGVELFAIWNKLREYQERLSKDS